MKFISIIFTFLATTLLFIACGSDTVSPNAEGGMDKNGVVVEEEHNSTGRMVKGSLKNGVYVVSNYANKLVSVYFAFDKYNLDGNSTESVLNAFKILNLPENIKKKVYIIGNADEFGSGEYNYSLGLKRAVSVKKALIANGFDSKRISIVSHGENDPVCRDKTKVCWAKNRRVDFSIK